MPPKGPPYTTPHHPQIPVSLAVLGPAAIGWKVQKKSCCIFLVEGGHGHVEEGSHSGIRCVDVYEYFIGISTCH